MGIWKRETPPIELAARAVGQRQRKTGAGLRCVVMVMMVVMVPLREYRSCKHRQQ
jgi:hypothetical protein